MVIEDVCWTGSAGKHVHNKSAVADEVVVARGRQGGEQKRCDGGSQGFGAGSITGMNGYGGGDGGGAVLAANGKADTSTARHVGAVPLHDPHVVGGSSGRVVAARESDGGGRGGRGWRRVRVEVI